VYLSSEDSSADESVLTVCLFIGTSLAAALTAERTLRSKTNEFAKYYVSSYSL